MMVMQEVVETHAYLSAADDAGMTPEERERAVQTVAADPMAGEVMVGTGGCRKLRLAGRGKGKSGGYRVITYFGSVNAPAYLLTVFSKGERTNLSKSEQNALAAIAKNLCIGLR